MAKLYYRLIAACAIAVAGACFVSNSEAGNLEGTANYYGNSTYGIQLGSPTIATLEGLSPIATATFQSTSLLDTGHYGDNSNGSDQYHLSTFIGATDAATITGANDPMYTSLIELSGNLNAAVAGVASFTVGGDDSVALYINGNLIATKDSYDPFSTAFGTAALLQGSNTFLLIYTNVEYNGGAGQTYLTFAGNFGDGSPITSANTSPVPEPSSLALAGLGAIGAAITAYRRRRNAV